MARVLADDYHKRVVIVDTSNEIGGDGDVPHPAVGGARRMQVADPSMQHKTMVSSSSSPLESKHDLHSDYIELSDAFIYQTTACR